MRAARIELVARRALDDRRKALADAAWYADARKFAESLAAEYGFTFETVAGVLAALSPMQEWRTQEKFTPLILSSASRIIGTSADLVSAIHGPGFNGNKRKAARILAGADPLDVLGGDKVRAFYSSILGDVTKVCVDRHALAIAYGLADVPPYVTAKRYRETAAAYTAASAALCAAFPSIADALTPCGVQALTWCWWRENIDARF